MVDEMYDAVPCILVLFFPNQILRKLNLTSDLKCFLFSHCIFNSIRHYKVIGRPFSTWLNFNAKWTAPSFSSAHNLYARKDGAPETRVSVREGAS